MSSQYDELQPTNGCDWFGSLEHLSKFQQVSHLGVVTTLTSLSLSWSKIAFCDVKVAGCDVYLS